MMLLPVVIAGLCLIPSNILSECAEARKQCTSYKCLVEALLENDTNHYNLQRAFFPPEKANPVFVTVTYCFQNCSTSVPTTETWYWTTSTFYLLQPLESLHFTSLLFADSHLRKENLTLYLESIRYVNNTEWMQLLTQRLKLYAMKQSSTAEIDDNYNPKAENVTTLKNLYYGNTGVWFSGAATWYALTFQIMFPICLCFCIALCFINILHTKKKYEASPTSEVQKKKLGNDEKITSLLTYESICVCSCSVVVYVVGLDIAAFARRAALTREDIFELSSFNAIRQQFAIIIVMLIEDLLIGFFTLFFSLYCLIRNESKKEKLPEAGDGTLSTSNGVASKENSKIKPALFLTGPILCIGVHSFHILVGFIHTPYHATSVLFLYSVAFFVYVFAMRTTYQNLYVMFITQQQEQQQQQPQLQSKHKVYIIISLVVLTFVLFVGIASVYLLLLFVPINLATEDGPTSLNTISQTMLAIIAAALTYRLFFKFKKKATSTIDQQAPAAGDTGGRQGAAAGDTGGRQGAAAGDTGGRQGPAAGGTGGRQGPAADGTGGRQDAAGGDTGGQQGAAGGDTGGRQGAAVGDTGGRQGAAAGDTGGRQGAAAGDTGGRQGAAAGGTGGRQGTAGGDTGGQVLKQIGDDHETIETNQESGQSFQMKEKSANNHQLQTNPQQVRLKSEEEESAT